MSVMFFITVSPYFSGTKTARTISFLRAYQREITFSLEGKGYSP